MPIPICRTDKSRWMTPSAFLFLHSDIRSDGRKNFEQKRTILQKGLGAAIKKVYNYSQSGDGSLIEKYGTIFRSVFLFIFCQMRG